MSRIHVFNGKISFILTIFIIILLLPKPVSAQILCLSHSDCASNYWCGLALCRFCNPLDLGCLLTCPPICTNSGTCGCDGTKTKFNYCCGHCYTPLPLGDCVRSQRDSSKCLGEQCCGASECLKNSCGAACDSNDECCNLNNCITQDQSKCPAQDTDGGYVLTVKGTCSWRICSSSYSCTVTGTQTDTCSGTQVYELYPDPANINLCKGEWVTCPSATPKCTDGRCVECLIASDCPACSGNRAENCTSNTCGCGVCQAGSSNSVCDAGYCCTGNNAPGPGTGTTCVSKGSIQSSIWLCDPGEWVECNENNLNSVQTFDGKGFKCIKEDNTYKWIDTTEQQQKTTGLFGFLNQVFNTILKLLGL